MNDASRLGFLLRWLVSSTVIAVGISSCVIADDDTSAPVNRTTNLSIDLHWIDDERFHYERESDTGKLEKIFVDTSTSPLTLQVEGTDDSHIPTNAFEGGPLFGSGTSEQSTEIEFVNQTQQPVQLTWIDSSLDRHDYNRLEPGESFRQHTYVGHVWTATGADATYYGRVIASGKSTPAIIKQTFPPPKAQRRGRGSQRQRSSNVSPNGKFEFEWKRTPAEDLPIYILESSPDGGGRAQLQRHSYALPGDEMDRFELMVRNLESGEPVSVDVPVVDFGYPRARWISDHQFVFEKVDRGHQRFRIFLVDAKTGEVTTPIDETSETFIWTMHGPPLPKVTYLDQSQEAIYASERDGWMHLYLVDLQQSKPMQAITQGNWIVRRIVHRDEKSRTLFLMVSGIHPDQDPYHQHLIRVGLDGNDLVILTEGDGDHEVEFSPDRKFFIDTYSRVDQPPVHELRSSDDGSLLAVLATAKRLVSDAAAQPLPTVFHAKARDGETDIWGLISFPPNYDSTVADQYPVIEHIYAGPHGSHVPKRYSHGGLDRELTSLGFVVVRIDGMGTANRSKAFHDVCWQNLKDAGFPDRIAWMKSADEKYPCMDLQRVGIFGTSAGGQNACGALLLHGDFYKAASASCGCHDNRMDKASWNEQWMGYPVGDHYAASSNIEHAEKLNGDLLLMVGELDTNVPPESTYRLVDALIKADKDFDFIMVPGLGHSDGGTYGRRRMREFFVEKLKPESSISEAVAASPSVRLPQPNPLTAWERIAERFQVDLRAMRVQFPLPVSPRRVAAVRSLLAAWQSDLHQWPTNELEEADRQEHAKLVELVQDQIQSLNEDESVMNSLFSQALFIEPLIELSEPLHRGSRLDWPEVAGRLTKLLQTMESHDGGLINMDVDALDKIVDQLNKQWAGWVEFHANYDPQFDFWVADLSPTVEQQLRQWKERLHRIETTDATATSKQFADVYPSWIDDSYPNLTVLASQSPSHMAEYLRSFKRQSSKLKPEESSAFLEHWVEELRSLTLNGTSFSEWNRGDQADFLRLKTDVETQLARLEVAQQHPPQRSVAGDGSDLAGFAVGRQRLELELRNEFIGDSPEELIELAEQGLQQCHRDMVEITRELGLGDDWHVAVEHIKTLHVQPGEQPPLVRQTAEESTEWLLENDLVSLDSMVRRQWQMEMMTPEQQKVNPFFTGGDMIRVSFPTRQMNEDQKRQSLRGNNQPFVRATVHHEWIPGHHLQLHQNERYQTQRSGFDSPFWLEGWAVYWEFILESKGFARTPEERLGYLVWRAHRFARIIFSLRFHLHQLSPDQCVQFLCDNVGFERQNSEAEVRRSIGDSYPPLYQTAYMLGAMQLQQLQKRWLQEQRGSLRDFHDAILCQGSFPIALVEAILFEDSLSLDHPPQWSFTQ